MSNFDEEINNLRRLGDLLIPYNFPRSGQEDEETIAPLKKTFVEVDGYGIWIYFNKADYGNYVLEAVHIFGASIPNLPFNLVLKIARKILGSSCLSYIELPSRDRKYYCWTVCLDTQGRPMMPQYDVKTEQMCFEGFDYTYMRSHQFNFY